jgi:LruC domain-containing protein
MKIPHIKFSKSFAVITVICGCALPEVEQNDAEIQANDPDEEAFTALSIPQGFDFSTYHDVQITITDNSSYVRYDIFGYSDESYLAGSETFENQSGQIVTEPVYKNDVMNKLLFTGVPSNGVLKQTINLPKYYDKLYIRRKENLNYSASIEPIIDKRVTHNFSSVVGRSSSGLPTEVNDYLYCVNGSGELFQVDPLNGQLTFLSNMPMGSWTCAIDQENKMLYSIGRSSPYPLMRYSIVNNSWEIVSNTPRGGPRLDYNYRDGLLYFSTRDKLYTYDPADGSEIDSWTINGLHSTSGGDLAFAEDGTLFLCTFSGLYRLELDANNEYQSTRISADNLPFQPTSMTFDSNQELWLANNASSSDLIIMDTVTGGWQYVYGTNAGNNTDLGRTINDLTTFRVYTESAVETDTDGDGILDQDDAFPENPDIAFEMYTPSKYGKGTLAFEDLWPSAGDYDFNDVALSYQAIVYLNAQNLAVEMDFNCYIKSNNAGLTNGIGFEIENLIPSQIQSVNGSVLVHDYISLDANGTESNQDKAVIILTDDSDYLLNDTNISIAFNQPLTTEQLGAVPFNPFIIVDMNREKEIHLPYGNTTALGNNIANISGLNSDTDGNYISDSGFPWAISIIHDFKVPKERIRISEAYNFFNDWAISGGALHKDWYKDNPGNRNPDKLAN